jgi:zinc protease
MSLMGGMLGEGTTTMNKAAFDEATDMIGADVNLSSAGGNVSALTRYFDKAFMLMADALRNPSFPSESFDKLKSQAITNLKAGERSATTIAARVTRALSYGKHTALGEFTTEESLNGLNLNDVKTAYADYITPSRSYLIFVGDITPEAAKALAIKAFGTWKGKKLELPVIADIKMPEKTEIDFIDVPTAVQGQLSFGNIIYNPLSGKDYFALLLANYILGGGAESKLFMNLREKHGFTYGAYSGVGSGRFPAMFNATAAVRTDKADSAVAELAAEILNMRDGKITDDELANAKARYNGSFALGMEDPSKAAVYAQNILVNNLPKDFYKTYLQKINAVTADDIKAAAKNYFSESNARIIIVGNGKKIIPAVMRLGYPIKKFDQYAEPVPDEVKDVNALQTPKSADAVSAYAVLQSYFAAIGGKEEAAKINSISYNISLNMMGRDLAGKAKKMNPDKEAMELNMGAITVFKTVFDGLQGYRMQGQNKIPFTEDELKDAAADKGIIPQLYYTSTEYLGTGKVGDEETYRLKVTMPNGRVSVQQYAVKSGLLLQEETTLKSKDGEDKVATVEYKDYRKEGTLMFAHNIIRNEGGQELNLKLSDFKFNEGVSEADFK